ncbi:MAG: LamG-like jellyroll fold domain-containing protein [Chloroherpetonaceae bacterium]|nr:LamG-like jellyroll fold domain-containing protein [Chloroherpetonaceae bacterium]
MRKYRHFVALIIVPLITAFHANAVTRTVSNNPQFTAAFTTIAAAITASSDGDTIVVVGSSTIYDANLVIAKQLVIIGPGYLLDQNIGLNPNPQAATIGNNPTFAAGSSGSSIQGMRFINVFTIAADVSDISVIRCMTGNGYGATFAGQINIGKKCNNILIQQCFMATRISMADSCANFTYRNNMSYEIIFAPASTTNMIFEYNLIGGNIGLSVFNATIRNNIYQNSASIANVANNVFQNNIFTGAQIPVGTLASNQFNVNFTSVVVGDSANSPDGIYRLKLGSPALGAGVNGSDIGPFGGETPYQISGVPIGGFGNHVTLNGINDYIQISDRVELRPAAVTIESRINLIAFPTQNIIGIVIKRTGQVTNNANWQLELFNQNNIRFSYYDGSVWRNVDTNTQPIANLNEWYHVAATFESGTARLYVNGNLLTTQTGLPAIRTDYAGQVQIGRGFEGYFNGKIDEVRIWNKARSQSDIQSTAQSILRGNDAGLVAYYTFNENTLNGQGRQVLNRSTSVSTRHDATSLNGLSFGTELTPIFLPPTQPLSIQLKDTKRQNFFLSQNYPNPFNPATTIQYQLPFGGEVKLVVYDMLGREVQTLVNTRQNAGSYQARFNASNVSSGVYFYKLEARSADSRASATIGASSNFVQTRKMLLVK